MDMKICNACADEARRLGIVVDVLDGAEQYHAAALGASRRYLDSIQQ